MHIQSIPQVISCVYYIHGFIIYAGNISLFNVVNLFYSLLQVVATNLPVADNYRGDYIITQNARISQFLDSCCWQKGTGKI